MKPILISWLLFSLIMPFSQAQHLDIKDSYLIMNAGIHDPVYTTYTAAMERSRLYGDQGYKMVHYDENRPISYTTEKSGEFFHFFLVNQVVVDKVGKFHKKPVIKASFPDMVIMEYELMEGLKVEETFLVYSSSLALVDLQITSTHDKERELVFYPVLHPVRGSAEITSFHKELNGYEISRQHSLKRLISNLSENYPYPTRLRDYFTANFDPYSYGTLNGEYADLIQEVKTDYYDPDFKNDTLNLQASGEADMILLHHKFAIQPGETVHLRYFRGTQPQDETPDPLKTELKRLKNLSLQEFVDSNVDLFESIPRINFEDRNEHLLYLSAFNLARGSMLPPEGEAKRNFYVFSREPLWGWGHGHQVLHESLSMLAYVYLDPQSAMDSQRIYMDQQGEDGLIAYRHGPRGPQTYPHQGKPTTSAPFFSWINWEVYKVAKDKSFLQDAYDSGSRYVDWLHKNRDEDGDGTFEWGPYGLIENVRDWYNVVFQVSKERFLDVDKEDISDELECLDLSTMVVKEMRSLSKMAEVLDKPEESKQWTQKADDLSTLIHERMWEDSMQFYFNVNREDHGFWFMDRDLRREEVIGFLPLWSESASPEIAEKLVQKLVNPDKFWRKNGVPTVAADDEWYSAYVDYCCKWNGPVWLLWDYMVFDGLLNYGYTDIAAELKNRLVQTVNTQLSRNHNFWESFSPDNEVLDSPANYIWDTIMAKMLIDHYLERDDPQKEK